MPPSLEFEGVRRDFGRLAVLRGVSARVGSGQLLTVLGANGSGKSTLLRCLAGLLRPGSGRIDYRENGQPLDAEDRRRRVGYVAPDLALYDELTAAENLSFFARLRGVDVERGTELLDRLEVPAARAFGLLSSGNRQQRAPDGPPGAPRGDPAFRRLRRPATRLRPRGGNPYRDRIASVGESVGGVLRQAPPRHDAAARDRAPGGAALRRHGAAAGRRAGDTARRARRGRLR